jgi:hypothetical protein
MADLEKLQKTLITCSIEKALAYRRGTPDEQIAAATKANEAAWELAKALVGAGSSELDNIVRVFEPGYFDVLKVYSVSDLERLRSAIQM